MDSLISGVRQRRYFQIPAVGSTAMAGARDKLLPPRRGAPGLSRAGPSLTFTARALNAGRFPPTEVLQRKLVVPRCRVALHESLRRAVCPPEALPEAHGELQQLLERVPLQQRPERTAGDLEEADRHFSLRENRRDHSSLLAEGINEVHDQVFAYLSITS